MTKTQRRKIKSEEWKKANDWGLSPIERTAKRKIRATERINEVIASGRDASLLIDVFNETFDTKFEIL